MTRQEMLNYLGVEEETDSSIVDTAMELQKKYDLSRYGLSLDGCFDDMPYTLESGHISEVTRENGIVVYRKCSNADRIRAMSDEELAELLIRQHACEHCEYHGNNATCKAPSEFTCTNLYAEGITLRWLKSEVKE